MLKTLLSAKLFETNRKKLTAKLKPQSLAVVLSNNEMPRNGDQFFPFRQSSDMFYLTGIQQQNTILLLSPGHAKYSEVLFISKPDPVYETWNGKRLTKDEASEVSGIGVVEWVEDFQKFFNDLVFQSEFIYLNSNENPRFSSTIETNDVLFIRDVKNRFPMHKLERLAPLLTDLRLIKEPEEVKIMHHACGITAGAFKRVLGCTKDGVYEYEIEAEISYEFRRQGAQGHAYYPIVASGANACVLHYVANNAVCRGGDLLLLDFGAEFQNYAADCSRTIPVNGHFNKRQRAMYNATLRVFSKARELMRKGTTIAHLNKIVGQLWEEEHVDLGLYSMEDLRRQDPEKPLYTKYFPHGIGHFLGLDVHDVGSRTQPIEPGMVLTCEPGIYVKEEGIGIRIENNILVTEDDPIDLMKTIPIETEEIEEIMNAAGN